MTILLSFIEHLRDFTRQFEMILEGEEHVDQARNHMEACEHREAKIRKELKKSAKKCSFEEVYQIKEKLFLAECSRDAARMEGVISSFKYFSSINFI